MSESVAPGLCQAFGDGIKYSLWPAKGIKRVIPSSKVGELYVNGRPQKTPFLPGSGDRLEFYPKVQSGGLTWELKLIFQGLSAVAGVKHEQAGRYKLPSSFTVGEELNLEQCAEWVDMPPEGEIWDEAKLQADLQQAGIVHGLRKEVWPEILAVRGFAEVVVAEATLPVPGQKARLEDYVGKPQKVAETTDQRVDFFASKVVLVKEGDILARKIPGKPGVPGMTVQGQVIPAGEFKDFQFQLKKNVALAEDGLAVIALCAGLPVHLDKWTYLVEQIYVLNTDVDLASGSIEFPGDVLINGNVQDGLRVLAGGRLEIRGSVNHAEIRAEKGAVIHQNLIGGKAVIGENFVFRSQLYRNLTELQKQLSLCLSQTAELLKSAGDSSSLKPGRFLKVVLEKRFPYLPKLSTQAEKFCLDHKSDEMVTEGLLGAVHTAKRFLTGLGPLEFQSLSCLGQTAAALANIIDSMSVEIIERSNFKVGYVQGAQIACGGAFECLRGAYNSEIRVEGDLKIEGVCRGGQIFAGGQVYIHELGGSGISPTFVQVGSNSHISVDYCHPNVIIGVEKEIIRIEEASKHLVIYKEKGRVEVEKIRVNPL